MGKIINRTIEFFRNEEDVEVIEEYYFHGEHPRANILVDDIFQCMYIQYAVNSLGQDIYMKIML